MQKKVKRIKFKAKLWKYDGKSGWYFVTLPKSKRKEIREFAKDDSAAWGSIRVKAKINNTTWQTSIFPDSKLDSYLLPVKAEVRKKEKLVEGLCLDVSLEIMKIEI